MRLSNAELASLVARTWPDGIIPQTGLGIRQTAYAIARAESGGRTEAIGDGGLSYGPWQVYTAVHGYDIAWLQTADGNAQAAYEISEGGSNFNSWCTWEASACGGNGKSTYWQYLTEADEALGSLVEGTTQPGQVTQAVPEISMITYSIVGIGALVAVLLLISSFGGNVKPAPFPQMSRRSFW